MREFLKYNTSQKKKHENINYITSLVKEGTLCTVYVEGKQWWKEEADGEE